MTNVNNDNADNLAGRERVSNKMQEKRNFRYFSYADVQVTVRKFPKSIYKNHITLRALLEMASDPQHKGNAHDASSALLQIEEYTTTED